MSSDANDSVNLLRLSAAHTQAAQTFTYRLTA